MDEHVIIVQIKIRTKNDEMDKRPVRGAQAPGNGGLGEVQAAFLAAMARPLLLILVLLALLSAPASADYEATEARLKTAGIDAALRKRIHTAIDRGVLWLVSQQRPDGGFAPDASSWGASPKAAEGWPSRVEYTALCGLALRHAGTPTATRAFAKAKAFLFESGSDRRRELASRTYEAGIGAMLIMADAGPKRAAQQLGAALVRGQSRAGSWGYETSSSGASPPVNISTAQFGALGLWASERAGAEIPLEAWTRLGTRFTKMQSRGRWGYGPRKGGAGRHYPQGTFMGLANLLLAEAALKRDPKAKKSLLKRIAKARASAMEKLAVDVPAFLAEFDATEDAKGLTFDFRNPYYGLYALEKVCIFANVEEIGGVRWYERGARTLLRKQKKDGGWGPVSTQSSSRNKLFEIDLENRQVCTSFALLFLLRGSKAYHPTTPSPVDGLPTSSGAITPSRSDPKAQPPNEDPKGDR